MTLTVQVREDGGERARQHQGSRRAGGRIRGHGFQRAEQAGDRGDANPFFTDTARGVEDEASMSGLSVILGNSDDQAARESRYLELLEEHRVQGILITPQVQSADGKAS
jgi:DNA-binding LacI/PurR family transcriptional regulator